MATKAELLEKAQAQGLDVNSSTTKKELESMLSSGDEDKKSTPYAEEGSDVVVNPNTDGEATNGTTREGDEAEIKNGEEIKQNGVTEVEVLGGPDAGGTETDKDRTETEVSFADEGNPDNKARITGAGGSQYDQDGNLRTGGKSYGVADDTNTGVSEDAFAYNAGEAREGRVEGTFFNPEVGSDEDTNNREWSVEDQKTLEESLSQPEEGIVARVTTSAGTYVRVKFFRNGLAFGTYKSRDFQEGEAQKYLDDLKESRGL